MKKIMFNDKYNLTELVLSGHKTMTRRIAKKTQCLDDLVKGGHSKLEIVGNKLTCFKDGQPVYVRLPYSIGEVIAVAQNYSDRCSEFLYHNSCTQCPIYDPSMDPCDEHPGYRNKMFVSSELMPHQIKITNIKIERLQDISDEDCIKEGIIPSNTWESHDLEGNKVIRSSYRVGKKNLHTPREAFAELFSRISLKGTWERNPYVFVCEFELLNNRHTIL